MRTVKMSWKTEGGRLQCRWVESQECEKFDADLNRLARSGVPRSYVTRARMANLVTLYKALGGGA